MTFLKVVLIIFIIFFLIGQIPIGADVAFEGGELRVSAKVCGALLQLIPKETSEKKPEKEKKKKKKEKKKKEEPEAEGGEKKEKKKLDLDFSYDEILQLVKKVLNGLGKFTKISVDRFKLYYVAAGDDPYATSNLFGYINAALCALAPICRKRFNCKDTDVFTDIDFTTDKQKLDFGIAITIKIRQIFKGINTILFGALWILIKNKVRHLFEKITSKFSKNTQACAET